MEKINDVDRKVMETVQQKLIQLLSPEQYSRLKQIYWQTAAMIAYDDPELVTGLSLLPSQIEQLKEVDAQSLC